MSFHKAVFASALTLAGGAAIPAAAQDPASAPAVECLSADITAARPGPYAAVLKKLAKAVPAQAAWSGLDRQLARAGTPVPDYCAGFIGTSPAALTQDAGHVRLVFNTASVTAGNGVKIIVPISPAAMMDDLGPEVENGVAALASDGVGGGGEPLATPADDIHSLVIEQLVGGSNMDAEKVLARVHAYLASHAAKDREALANTPYAAPTASFVLSLQGRQPTSEEKDAFRRTITATNLADLAKIRVVYGTLIAIRQMASAGPASTAAPIARPDDEAFKKRFTRFGHALDNIDVALLRRGYEQKLGQEAASFEERLKTRLHPDVSPSPTL